MYTTIFISFFFRLDKNRELLISRLSLVKRAHGMHESNSVTLISEFRRAERTCNKLLSEVNSLDKDRTRLRTILTARGVQDDFDAHELGIQDDDTPVSFSFFLYVPISVFFSFPSLRKEGGVLGD